MKRIRWPKYGRSFAPLFFIFMIVSALLFKSWPLTLLFLVISLVVVVVGKNYWECSACGELIERV